MTNDQLCDLIGVVGCIIAFLGEVYVFFGVTEAALAVGLGALLSIVGLANYNP